MDEPYQNEEGECVVTTRVNYQKELAMLGQSLEEMGELVENNIEKSLAAFEKRNVELAQ